MASTETTLPVPVSPTTVRGGSGTEPRRHMMDAEPHRHQWTNEEVYRAMAAGVFGGEPVDLLKMELIDGELMEKMTQNRPHSIALALGQGLLMRLFAEGHYVASQVPLHVDDYNEPEPDLMVVLGSPRDYPTHPTGAQTRLVMEIADTSHGYDRGKKADLYARAGVTDYWVLILSRRVLEVRRDPAELPDAPGEFQYQTLLTFDELDSVAPLHAPNVAISVAELLPLEAPSEKNEEKNDVDPAL